MNSRSFAGDVNAFFGLALDNISNFVFLTAILVFQFGFPLEVVLLKMIPGTALGVMFGDLVYTAMARRLDRERGGQRSTAIPLGLDTPSTIGLAYAVLGPSFLAAKAGGLDVGAAAVHAWQVGVAVLFLIGILKFFFSLIGRAVERMFPEAALLGSLAGIGIALLGALPLVDIFANSVAGIMALAVLVFALLAKRALPANAPAVFVSVALGTVLYYLGGTLGYGTPRIPTFSMALTLPHFSVGFWQVIPEALHYLPVAIPFALMTIIGGINVTAAARLAGDNYSTRSVLMTEAGSTLLSAFFGGVCQTTPYIGHSAYKAMGGGSAYTLATGLFMGIGGALGIMSFLADALPTAALAPILVFVGIDIVDQAFHSVPRAHAPAVALSMLPALAELMRIKLLPLVFDIQRAMGELAKLSQEVATRVGTSLEALSPSFQEGFATISLLGHGFLITSMIWGGVTVQLIERRYVRAGLLMALGGIFSFFGIMHSVSLDGSMYLPWNSPFNLHGPSPALLACAYALSGLLFVVFGKLSPEAVATDDAQTYPWQVHQGLDRARFSASSDRTQAQDLRRSAVGEE